MEDGFGHNYTLLKEDGFGHNYEQQKRVRVENQGWTEARANSIPSCHLLCTFPRKDLVPVRPACIDDDQPSMGASCIRLCINQSPPLKVRRRAAQVCMFLSLDRCASHLVARENQRVDHRPCCLHILAEIRPRRRTKSSRGSSG